MRTLVCYYKINYLILHWNYGPQLLGQLRIYREVTYRPCAMAVVQGLLIALYFCKDNHFLCFFQKLNTKL